MPRVIIYYQKSAPSGFHLIYYITRWAVVEANFIILYNIRRANPEDGIGRKGNAPRRKKYVT